VFALLFDLYWIPTDLIVLFFKLHKIGLWNVSKEVTLFVFNVKQSALEGSDDGMWLTPGIAGCVYLVRYLVCRTGRISLQTQLCQLRVYRGHCGQKEVGFQEGVLFGVRAQTYPTKKIVIGTDWSILSQNQQMRKIINKYKMYLQPLHMFRQINCHAHGVVIEELQVLIASKYTTVVCL
jgi:hypothetical protein